MSVRLTSLRPPGPPVLVQRPRPVSIFYVTSIRLRGRRAGFRAAGHCSRP